MKSRLRLLLFLCGCGFILAWFLAHIEAVGGRPLTFMWGADPHIYDPQQTSNPIAFEIFRHACEPLFYEFEGSVWGLLAEDEVAFRRDGHEVVVSIRPGIFFHDGTELTAEIVQASFQRLQILGKSPLFPDLQDVTIQTEGKFVIFTLPEPDYEFVRLTLTDAYAAVVLPTPQADNFPICTGPYAFAPERYHPDKSLILVRHERYRWPPHYFKNQGMPKIPRLEILFEADGAKRLDLLQTGRGCVLSLESADALASVRIYEAMGGVSYLGFNQLNPVWQDAAVRRALALAVDKERLAASGPYWVAQTPLTPAMVGYDSQAAAQSHPFAPAQSRALLQEQGFNFTAEYTLLIPESNTYRQLAQFVLADITAVGLTHVQLREASRANLLRERQNFDLLFFDYAWSDYTALANFLGATPNNLLNYPADDISSLVREARQTAVFRQKQALILQAQELILQKTIWEPLLIRQLYLGVNSRCVSGERQLENGLLVFHDAQTR